MVQDVRWTEVDGVPVAWVDLKGPLRAGLAFRAGVANETLPLHGVTHLVEHLALHQMHDRPYGLNGMTDLTRTLFYAAGSPTEMKEFLGSICTRLGDLASDRVEVERQVLRAEADARTATYREGLLFWRYGAVAHGLAGLDEYGLRWLDADTVRWWATERFTRSNAILMLTGKPPRGLRLPLPDGPAHPPVVANAVEQVIPGWAATSAAGVALGAVAPRTRGAMLAAGLLDMELSRVLRFERGLTYSVGTGYEPLDATQAHVVFSADADEARHAEVRDAFLGVVEHLAEHGIGEALFAAGTARRDRIEDDDKLLGYLNAVGSDFATGRAHEPVAERDADLLSATPDDVDAVIRAIAESAMYVVPHGIELPERYPPVPGWSADTVTGETFRRRDGNGALVVGPEGVSRVHEGNAVTVRWSETVGALWWGDGSRAVMGRDGFRVVVVPGDWERGTDVVARIDALAPRAVAVPMGDQGPQPSLEPAPPPTKRNRALWWVSVAVGYFLALALVVAGLDGPEPATATSEEITQADATGMLVFGLMLLAGSAFTTWWLVKTRARYAE